MNDKENKADNIKDVIEIEPVLSQTDEDQKKIEGIIKKIFERYGFSTSGAEEYESHVVYLKKEHYHFANKGFLKIPLAYKNLESGMPWFPYWILNIIEMCKDEYEMSINVKLKFVDFLKELQHPEGGFRGGCGGLSHIVSNYAAVMAILNLGIKEAYDIIDIPKMRQFLLKMKNNNFKTDEKTITDKNGEFVLTKEKEGYCSSYFEAFPGAFSAHYNGESDLRATYCALTVASILNILDDELTQGVVENIKKCQTFEGGIAPAPFCEAHGGYSYCGIATLILLNKLHEIDVKSFVRWIVNRQMTVEGGFNGRTNKLVDSCYSFWQGSVFNLLSMGDSTLTYDKELLYDQLSLQAYILFCCQNPNGGLFDKPGKPPDFFHTNYATAGLICSQECFIDKTKVCLYYDLNNEFKDLNPIFCVPESKVRKARKYFQSLSNKTETKKE